MKASLFYTGEFQNAYSALISQELPISEAKKIVQIDKEINELKDKISSYKDQMLEEFNKKKEVAETEGRELEDPSEQMSDNLTKYANSLDYVPSKKLNSEILLSVKLSAQNYAYLVDFFE